VNTSDDVCSLNTKTEKREKWMQGRMAKGNDADCSGSKELWGSSEQWNAGVKKSMTKIKSLRVIIMGVSFRRKRGGV